MPYIESQLPRSEVIDLGGLLSAVSGNQAPGWSVTDALTGLPGLADFYRQGTPIVDRCLAIGQTAAIAIIDVDHLRRINEGHCEDVGDRVLKSIGTYLRDAISGTPHLVARLGEEEFGLLLVSADDAAATEFCETMRQEIAALSVDVGDENISVSVSIGVAEIYGRETFDNYLNAAEQFLFMAKSNGRNQVFSDHTMLAGMN
jgi:diguanylate cyclase (GGDEF)-like protein